MHEFRKGLSQSDRKLKHGSGLGLIRGSGKKFRLGQHGGPVGNQRCPGTGSGRELGKEL